MTSSRLFAILLCALALPAAAQVTTRDLGGHYGTHQQAVPVPVPVPVPDTFNRDAAPSEPITTRDRKSVV